jgi:AraC family transcriptional regulator of adaptative response/methylated-DNA-[protein]-cysteine methyltransferase
MFFAIRKSALGWILVAGDENAVAWISLGGSPRELQAELRAAFQQTDLVEGGPAHRWAQAAEAYVRDPAAGLKLPLRPHGTEFQRKVWSALARIPLGSTMTYGEIAAALGSASSARAVAQACAANRIAVAIPCHRVVGRDGDIKGYRWKPEVKRRLLAIEEAAITETSLRPQAPRLGRTIAPRL